MIISTAFKTELDRPRSISLCEVDLPSGVCMCGVDRDTDHEKLRSWCSGFSKSRGLVL